MEDSEESRVLAKKWVRELLTVLLVARKEEAKGEHLSLALDLFVKVGYTCCLESKRHGPSPVRAFSEMPMGRRKVTIA